MHWAHYGFPHLQYLGMAGYVVVFWVSFLESLIFTGMFVPGTVIVVIAGSMASHGFYSFWLIVAASTMAAMLGDAISYELGRLGESKLEKWPFFRKHIERGRPFFIRHQRKSIILGRFIGFTRPVIPFIAGVAEMDRSIYYKMNVVSGFLWSVFYTGLGYLFGPSWKLAFFWTTHALFVLLALVILWFFLKWAFSKQ